MFNCKPGYSTKLDDFKGVHTTSSFVCDAHGDFDVVQECINIDDCLESECGEILLIPQEAMLLNTTPAHAIQGTPIPLLVELTGRA